MSVKAAKHTAPTLTRKQKLFLAEVLHLYCAAEGRHKQAAAILWKLDLPQHASFLKERGDLLAKVRRVSIMTVASRPDNHKFQVRRALGEDSK